MCRCELIRQVYCCVMVAGFDWTTATVTFLASSRGCCPNAGAGEGDPQQDERLGP